MTEADSSQCSLQFVGTATLVLRLGSLTLLTDPNFLHRGQRAYLGYGLSSVRLTEPALSIGDLPPLDAIVLSHMHGDHWDRVGKRLLPHDVSILTTPKAARALHRQGFTAGAPLRTWESSQLERDGHVVTVTAVPGRHARGIAARLLPPVMGSVIDYRSPAGRALRLYITGDTLMVDDLRPIPLRFPDVDVAVLHLGGTTLPGGLMVTMDARQGVDLLQLVHPRTAVPVHNDDYGVFASPLSAFLAEADKRGMSRSITVVAPGEQLTL